MESMCFRRCLICDKWLAGIHTVAVMYKIFKQISFKIQIACSLFLKEV